MALRPESGRATNSPVARPSALNQYPDLTEKNFIGGGPTVPVADMPLAVYEDSGAHAPV